MAFNWEQGLASFGESVARTAQVMGVEAMRASLENDRMKLAQEYALNRENIGRQFEMEKQRADQDFRKPAQDAQIEANKAQVDKYRTDTDLAKANEARLQKGIEVARGGSGGDVLARSREAIASIEQGPEGYASIGPETTYKDGTKDKPYGRYQVMGKNIPQWTKEALGREMTPEEFVKDQKAQDAVFNHRFGSYLEKYGNPQDAASAWFSGRPLSKAGNDKDVLGTSVPGYVAKFNEKFGTSGAPAGDRSRAGLVETGQLRDVAELDFRREQEQAKRDAPPDGAKLAEWWRKATPEQRQAMSDVLNMQREGKESWMPLNEEMGRRMLGSGYDPNKSYQVNRATGEIKPIGGAMVNIDQKGETTALKTQIEAASKAHTELQEGAKTARTGLAQVERLNDLMNQLSTGKFSATELEIKRTAKALGIDLGEKEIGVAEAADALSKQLALQMRNPAGGAGMPGAMSDADREYLLRTIPTLGTSPEGRALMVEMARKMYQRTIEEARIANQYLRSKEFASDPSGLYAKLQEHADANPMFPQATPSGAEGDASGFGATGGPKGPMDMPRLGEGDRAAFNAMPSGTIFLDPDGRMRRKP